MRRTIGGSLCRAWAGACSIQAGIAPSANSRCRSKAPVVRVAGVDRPALGGRHPVTFVPGGARTTQVEPGANATACLWAST